MASCRSKSFAVQMLPLPGGGGQLTAAANLGTTSANSRQAPGSMAQRPVREHALGAAPSEPRGSSIMRSTRLRGEPHGEYRGQPGKWKREPPRPLTQLIGNTSRSSCPIGGSNIDCALTRPFRVHITQPPMMRRRPGELQPESSRTGQERWRAPPRRPNGRGVLRICRIERRSFAPAPARGRSRDALKRAGRKIQGVPISPGCCPAQSNDDRRGGVACSTDSTAPRGTQASRPLAKTICAQWSRASRISTSCPSLRR